MGRAGARRGPRKEVVLTGVSSASSPLTTCATTDDGCGQRRSLQTNLGVCQALGETILDAFCAPQLTAALEKRIGADVVCDGAEDTRDAYRRTAWSGELRC